MERRKPREMTFEERHLESAAAFDVGVDPNVTLVDLVRAAGDFLSMITGPEATDAGMKLVIGKLALDGPSDWRSDLESEASGATEWPMGDTLYSVFAYAYYGIDTDEAIAAGKHDDAKKISERLEARLRTVLEFLRLCPLETWLGEDRQRQLETTVSLARNRWELDHGRPVEPEAIAVFGDVKLSRIRNMMAGKDATFHRDENGRIPAAEALVWLEGRDTFFPSIWRSARRSPDTGQVKEPAYEAPVFVPEAGDRSIFHPGLARKGGFTVGEKGEERQIASFDEALLELQRMPTPSWRRPSQGRGGWSLVRGTTWVRTSREELDRAAHAEQHGSDDGAAEGSDQ